MHLLSLLQQQFLLLYWFIPFSKQTCPNVAHLLRNSRMSFLLPLFFLTPLPSRLLKNSCLGLLAPPPRFLVFLQPASVEFSAVTSRGSAGSSEQVAGLAAVGGCTGSEGGSGDGDNGDSRGPRGWRGAQQGTVQGQHKGSEEVLGAGPSVLLPFQLFPLPHPLVCLHLLPRYSALWL